MSSCNPGSALKGKSYGTREVTCWQFYPDIGCQPHYFCSCSFKSNPVAIILHNHCYRYHHCHMSDWVEYLVGSVGYKTTKRQTGSTRQPAWPWSHHHLHKKIIRGQSKKHQFRLYPNGQVLSNSLLCQCDHKMCSTWWLLPSSYRDTTSCGPRHTERTESVIRAERGAGADIAEQ